MRKDKKTKIVGQEEQNMQKRQESQDTRNLQVQNCPETGSVSTTSAESKEENQEKQEKPRLKLDQLMKNMFLLSDRVNVNMLNSLFNENYDPENTTVVLTNNEFVLAYDNYHIIRGDIFITMNNTLQEHKEPHKIYHIDFQTLYDPEMVIRMFSYGLGHDVGHAGAI